MNLPLKARLTLWYVTLFALIIGVWSVAVVVVARRNLQAGTDRALASRATQIVAGFSGGKDSQFAAITDATLKGVPRTESVAQLLSDYGSVLEFAGDPVAKAPMVTQGEVDRALSTGSAQLMTIVAADERYRVLLVRLPHADRVVLIGTATESTDSAVERLVLVMLLSGPILLIAAGVGGWFLAGRALRPVARMSRTAALIGIDDLDARVPVPPGNDELSILAETLNSMLERLKEGVREKRRFVADASHELQTPLAVMRTELDVSLASADLTPDAIEVLESAREETDRMTRIVRNLLTLARFDEGTLRLLRAPTNLSDVAEEAVDSLANYAKGLHVAVSYAGASAPVNGDAEYLRMVVVNLLENAIKYAGEGASVTLSTGTDGEESWLSVTDTGPGIDAAAAARVFDRFYRADRSRAKETGGSGLGLALSQEIVDAHHGRIELASEVGVGSTFTIRLPLLGQAPPAETPEAPAGNEPASA